jgi:tetratricopeptide (TPR) repeat protein
LQAQENYADAVPEVEAAVKALPNDSEIIYQAASLHRRLGHWRQSLTEFQKAVQLDPRNFNGPTDLAYHLSLMRDWPGATAAWDRALAIVPEFMFNKIVRAYVDFWSRGDLARGKALLDSSPADYAGQFKEFLAWMRWDFNLLQRDYDASAQAVDSIKDDPASGGFLGPITRSYMRGCIELARGNRDAATALFAESCKFFEERARKAPNRAHGHARLAMTYAFMGRKDDALREAARARELCPESKDAFDGACISTGVAVAYAWAGETDRAIAEVERLLRTPGALNYDCSITLNDLKHRWLWDPLRSDPRFQYVLAGPEPQTIVP